MTNNFFYFSSLVVAFQRLYRAGIVQIYLEEAESVSTFERGQDRIGLVGKTNFNYERDVGVVETLKWQGKMITILILWMICKATTLISFFSELSSLCLIKITRHSNGRKHVNKGITLAAAKTCHVPVNNATAPQEEMIVTQVHMAKIPF